MIQITDSSSQILFDKQKQHNELLQTINATVNHEIRNPLNSIEAFNQQNLSNFDKIIKIVNNNNFSKIIMKSKVTKILDELKDANQIQTSSTKIIKFLIQDMLDYS